MSVVHLWRAGGLSRVDSLYPRPDAKAAYRSQFKPISTNVDGIQICEHLPQLAKMADKYCIIRSMSHKIADHGQAMTFVMTGREQLPTIQCPSMPAVVAKELVTGS